MKKSKKFLQWKKKQNLDISKGVSPQHQWWFDIVFGDKKTKKHAKDFLL